MKHHLLSAFAALMAVSSLPGQVRPAQVIARIPAEKADISVASVESHYVALTIEDTTYRLNAQEAARLALWIKGGTTDTFSGNDRIEMKRKKDSFVLKAPAGKDAIKLNLRKEWAYQLANALESGRSGSPEMSRP